MPFLQLFFRAEQPLNSLCYFLLACVQNKDLTAASNGIMQETRLMCVITRGTKALGCETNKVIWRVLAGRDKAGATARIGEKQLNI